MHCEQKIISLDAGYRVYAEHYVCQGSRGTVLMVNGAFATVTSLHHTIKYLQESFNVIAFDLPFAGQSRELNSPGIVLTKEEEVNIVLEMMEYFRPDFAISMSWGGVSLLLALAQRPKSVRRAVLGSFAPSLNKPMREYLQQTLLFLDSGNFRDGAALFNSTLGSHLPRLFKTFNARYLGQFAEEARGQIGYHIRNILELDASQYTSSVAAIEIPLMFINGELDAYTTAESIRDWHFQHTEVRRERVPGAGHFLDMEGKAPWRHMRSLITHYLTEHSHAVELA